MIFNMTLYVNMNMKSLSRVQLFVTPWTVAYQAPLSMEFSREEYWSGLLFPSVGDLPDPGIEPRSPTLQAMLYHLSHQGSMLKHLYTLLVLSSSLPHHFMVDFLLLLFAYV